MMWFSLLVVGAVIGTLASFFSQRIHMPRIWVVLIATASAVAGGALALTTGFHAFGRLTIYISGAGLALGVIAGAVLAFSLTNEEKRV
jgi:hypothetical protein